MCDRPILIDNPYLGLKNVGLNRFHDCTSQKIPVPCGNCPTCIALRQNYFIQRCQMEAIDNHLFFATFTYQSSYIPRKKVNNRILYYPDFKDVQNMFKRLRNDGLIFKYLVVSEYGSTHHRPHFHAIISVPKGDKDTYHDIMNLEHELYYKFLSEWRRNYGSKRVPIYKPLCLHICNHKGSTFDFHYVHPASSANGEQDVAFYVTKYVTKSDKWVDNLKSALKFNLEPDDFEEIWKLFKPRCNVSKGFGSYSSPKVKYHIRKGIDASLHDDKALFPYFINPVTGQTFPLAPVFQKRFLTLKDKEIFFSRSDFEDGYHETDDRNVTKELVNDARFAKVRNSINSRLTNHSFIYDDEIKNVCPEAQIKDSCVPDLPDSWISDFEDSF